MAALLPSKQPVEIYYHKSGYNPNISSHTRALFSRRRYRLKPGHPSAPPETANLWLFHYIPAEHQNQIPIADIPITVNIRQSFTARNYIAQLFQSGQLPRKEFYLHDRNAWPVITLPTQMAQQPQHLAHIQVQQHSVAIHAQTPQHGRQISPMNTRVTPQPSQPPVQPVYYTPVRAPPKGGAPSAKRLKPTPPHASAAQAAALGGDPGASVDEEEDTSRGDVLDHLSPREIATTRYMQHHEWMEEVMGSPYAIDKIRPVDLGLGLRGELESVTRGLLDLPTQPPPPKPRPGETPKGPEEKDQQKVLQELRPRVENKIKQMEDEIARMEVAHARRLQKIKFTGVTKDAELKLRVGLGIWPQQPQGGDASTPSANGEAEEKPVEIVAVKDLGAVEEIVREVEQALGKVVVEKKMLIKCDLPVEEIIKMGGAVADGDGQPNTDTVMGDGSNIQLNGDGIDVGRDLAATTVEDEFDLTLGNLPDENNTDHSSHQSEMGFPPPPPPDASSAANDLLPPIPTPRAAEEDTIMNDFMNVDQDSKPDTPNVEERKEAEPTPPVAAQESEEAFRFSPPTEKVEDGSSGGGIPGLGLVDGN